jgi:DNA helicase-2/ATP-dependent DNA helicase PcrA
MENIQEFENAVLHFEKNNPDSSLINFLETITLDSQTDETSSETAKPQEQISLMTIHGAKGLEFSHAFIVGAEEQVFPSYRSLEDGARGIEEERRLFYVAMTRAMKRLCITFAQGRTVFGQFRFNGPSRFLNEIQANHVNWIHLASKQENEEDDDWSSKSQKLGYKKSSDDYSQDLYQESFDDDSYTVASKGINGQKVIHKVYGPGVIVETSGHGNDAKVTIKFRDGIRKKFLIKHSPIEFITS